MCAACVIVNTRCLLINPVLYTKKIEQATDSVVAVLEKVASLDDKEEVARLAEEAEGRKFFFRL